MRLADVCSENRAFRIDAQYFSKRALEADARLKTHDWEHLLAVAGRIESFGAYALTNQFTYVEDGIPFLRGANIRKGFAEFADVLFIDEAAHTLLSKSEVKPGMVLLTMSGSVGGATVALPSWPYPLNSNQDIAKITPKAGIRAEYLAAFLASSYGQVQMDRLPVGSVQQHIFLWMIEQLVVPRFGEEFESLVANTVLRAYDAQAGGKRLQERADGLLTEALGLKDWTPPEPLTFTRPASHVFASGRLDSRFFAPRVEQLLEKLRGDGRAIGDVAPPRRERFRPSTGTFRYIEIGSVRTDGTADAVEIDHADAPSRATSIVRGGDVVTSTVRPIRRLSALIDPSQDGCVCSSGFVVLEPTAVPPELLLTYLRLPPVCELMDLHTSASLYPAISEADIVGLPFPRIQENVCAEIVLAVSECHSARAEAERLLSVCSEAIQLAVEGSVAAALTFIRSRS